MVRVGPIFKPKTWARCALRKIDIWQMNVFDYFFNHITDLAMVTIRRKYSVFYDTATNGLKQHHLFDFLFVVVILVVS